MRSNKQQDITTTTYIHNNDRGRPVSQVLRSVLCSKVEESSDDGTSDSKSNDLQKTEVNFPVSEQPINLSFTCYAHKTDATVN